MATLDGTRRAYKTSTSRNFFSTCISSRRGFAPTLPIRSGGLNECGFTVAERMELPPGRVLHGWVGVGLPARCARPPSREVSASARAPAGLPSAEEPPIMPLTSRDLACSSATRESAPALSPSRARVCRGAARCRGAPFDAVWRRRGLVDRADRVVCLSGVAAERNRPNRSSGAGVRGGSAPSGGFVPVVTATRPCGSLRAAEDGLEDLAVARGPLRNRRALRLSSRLESRDTRRSKDPASTPVECEQGDPVVLVGRWPWAIPPSCENPARFSTRRLGRRFRRRTARRNPSGRRGQAVSDSVFV